ncbi:MAG: DUF481 domain-containing protein [Pseudomonadota bacterium]
MVSYQSNPSNNHFKLYRAVIIAGAALSLFQIPLSKSFAQSSSTVNNATEVDGVIEQLLRATVQSGHTKQIDVVITRINTVRDALVAAYPSNEKFINQRADLLVFQLNDPAGGGSISPFNGENTDIVNYGDQKGVATIATPTISTEGQSVATAEANALGTDTDPANGNSRAMLKQGFWSLRPWEGNIAAGASSATGNSDNAAVSLNLDAERTFGRFTGILNTYLNIGEANDQLNQKRWGMSYKVDRSLKEKIYTFTRFSYDEDEFSGYDYRLFAGAGAGYFITKQERRKWRVEAGPGFRYSPIDDNTEIEQEIAFYAATTADWEIREGIKFKENARVTYTNLSSTFEATTTLSVPVWEQVTTGLSFYYRFETDPPFERENTDTVLSATLGYDF